MNHRKRGRLPMFFWMYFAGFCKHYSYGAFLIQLCFDCISGSFMPNNLGMRDGHGYIQGKSRTWWRQGTGNRVIKSIMSLIFNYFNDRTTLHLNFVSCSSLNIEMTGSEMIETLTFHVRNPWYWPSFGWNVAAVGWPEDRSRLRSQQPTDVSWYSLSSA